MEFIDRILMIASAIAIAGWSSHVCSKKQYSAKNSFLYGFRNGILVAISLSSIFYVLNYLGVVKSTAVELSTGLIIVLIMGGAYGFYCWEQAIKDGR